MRLLFGRRAVPLTLLVAAVLLLTAAPLLAADPHAGEKGGLGFMALKRYDLGIFTLIVFGLLCLILFRFAWPKISEGLEKREAVIRSARDEAFRTKTEAEDLRVKLNAEYAQAQDTIRAMMDEARRDAEVLRAREREVGSKEAAVERDRAKREIEAAKEVALQEIYQQSVQLASLMSSKAIRRNLSEGDHKALVDESIAELKAGRM